jgi:DNA-binding NtrC family response regulator
MGQSNSSVILVADDEPVVRQFVRTALEMKGYRVIVADDGEHALELSRAFPGQIHLLLSDVKMPRMRGPDLADVIVQERPGIRVRLMTGKSSGAIPDEWKRTLIRKPFAARLLLDAVEQALAA